jgi:hypothetical protein
MTDYSELTDNEIEERIHEISQTILGLQDDQLEANHELDKRESEKRAREALEGMTADGLAVMKEQLQE